MVLNCDQWISLVFKGILSIILEVVHVSNLLLLLLSDQITKCYNVTNLCIYKYHHSKKLHRKISQICCHPYCYECAARITMPSATNEWCLMFFPGRALYYGDNDVIIWTFGFIASSDAAYMTCSADSCVTCSTDTDSRVTCSKYMSFYKLHSAARLPHCHVS